MWSCLLICTRCSSAQLPILCDTRLGEVNSAGLLVDETLGERLWPTFCHWDVNCVGASVNNVMCLDLRLSVKELEYGCDMIKTTPLGAWTSFRYPEHGLRAVRQNPGVEDRLVGRKVDQGERPPLDHDECFNSLSCGSQLTDLIGRCWHKDPEARPSAAAVVEELRSIYPVVPWTDLHFAGGQDVDGGGQPRQVLQGWWQNAPVTIEVVDMDDITCSQFLAQIAMLRNLNHANIVGLLAASEQEGKQHAGLVWESAEHDDLHPALPNADAWRALSTSMKLACVADVAEALDYLHSQSPPIIHGRTTTTCLFLIRFCLTKLIDRHKP
ncbi:uncharacterized protein ACA1_397230 [Acanthamoeba castellanii str. Neff]|uniref:Protein kinase domain-containing protein n=1 Tax=Acanthamoeba castellanii (strain ATCC 30010 / Neff) TaxID=1257118 RepID=L8HCA9_ACACF|nr:uncharacterized protein ACA1_397230 [Acanthamoeba castellanii str. Neff]ELR22877.1 hypothetical protein ACA1_397230 [Acanthamoeba castellanii str. Neff]